MNLAAFLHRTALLNPDATALGQGIRRLDSYRDFARRVAVLAGQMTGRLGLQKGDRAAIIMANVPDYMAVKYACWHAGICAVPINAKLHRKEFAFILENSGARVCFTNGEKREAIAGLDGEIATLERIVSTDGELWAALAAGAPVPMAEVEPDDPAWLFYTSGTTGRPKGAVLSHRNLVSQTMNYFADVGDIAPGDCIVHCAPASHGSGCYGIPHVACGAAQVFPDSGGFDPAEMLDLLQHWPGASFFFAPTMVVRLLNYPGLAGRRYRQSQADRLWRGADVCRGSAARHRHAGPEIRPDLRPGRGADDDHRPDPGDARGDRPSALPASGSAPSAWRGPMSKSASSMPAASRCRPARSARSCAAATS